MTVKCGELMTPNPDYCSPTATVQQVAAIMNGRDIGVIPVVDGNKLVGVVTDRDLTKVLGNAAATDQTLIGTIMSTPPICCRKDDDIEVAVALMKMFQFKRIPIVNDDATLVGLISLTDIVNCLENSELTGQIIHEIFKVDDRFHATSDVFFGPAQDVPSRGFV